MPALIAALKDQKTGVRISAAYALGQIGPEAKEAVSALLALLSDRDKYIRSSAADALRKIDPATFSTELKISP